MLDWLYTAIGWLLKQWHTLFATFLDPASGLAWVLAIVALVVTVRSLLFPLFVKQIHSSQAMQQLQPEIAALRAQHGEDKQAFSQAVMALQKERGVNPLAGCLPALAQAPVFIALLHVLRRIRPGKAGLYTWSFALTQQAAGATIAGAPISSSFAVHAAGSSTAVVAAVLVVAMVTTSFLTQKTIQRRSGPVDGPAASVQRMMLFGVPASLLLTGSVFPVGVLVYWTTNNLWTLGQQLHVLRRFPAPPPPAPPLPASPPPAG